MQDMYFEGRVHWVLDCLDVRKFKYDSKYFLDLATDKISQ